MTPAEQARAFAAMMACGVCMGVTYDVLGVFRRVRGLCMLTDMLFGICCALGVIWTALQIETDAFRLYAFAGAACGMVLYSLTVGTILRRIAAHMRRWMVKKEERRKKDPSPAGN